MTTSSNCPRFVVLANFDNSAVLDRETGLIWQRTPSDTRIGANRDLCRGLAVGSREGWRLPTMSELRSLIDSSQISPSLPAGHPFTNLHLALDDVYWTSTQDLLNPSNFLLVGFAIPASAPASVRNQTLIAQAPRFLVPQISIRSCLWMIRSAAIAFGSPSENGSHNVPRFSV